MVLFLWFSQHNKGWSRYNGSNVKQWPVLLDTELTTCEDEVTNLN